MKKKEALIKDQILKEISKKKFLSESDLAGIVDIDANKVLAYCDEILIDGYIDSKPELAKGADTQRYFLLTPAYSFINKGGYINDYQKLLRGNLFPAVLLVLILIIWSLNSVILSYLSPQSINLNINDRGLLGDSFGVINSLFSGLAFAGVIYTILLQRNELALQRAELKATKLELRRSANAQELQQKELKRQAENLKVSAELSALSTIISYYNQRESTLTTAGRHKQIRNEEIESNLNKHLQRVFRILDKKQ